MNKLRRWPLTVLVASVAALSGCASNTSVQPEPRASYSTAYGSVQNIEVVPVAHRGPGAGAVLGAVIGGVLGNQVGGGTGRAVATVGGAVGGAMIGNAIQKRNADDVYRVSVRLDSGAYRSFDFQRIDDLQVGDRVRVEGGQMYRG
ncbi:glycine zipper 2TM domain-containing protein [Aquabacterium sp.]|uniref:glycine zipper 2TM domain-containing protein n=1 Tax=Aquabacterium sp. TaxID=1872578 RepID=UPI002BB42C26|nr:glycine zipper 2TM domain-containing protein [Aquabacterium sp.]HSW05865.1 glycine zipper 2TM domain-containing protein [Aquabacterium sp.]